MDHVGSYESTPECARRRSAHSVRGAMDHMLGLVREHGGAALGGRWVMGSSCFAEFRRQGGGASHAGYLIAVSDTLIGIGFESAPSTRMAA